MRTFLAGLIFAVATSLEGAVTDLDWNAAHDMAAPLPRFITHHYIALPDVESLSKFRSGYGHVFTDEYEAPDRSMKHYIAPLPSYRNGNATSLRAYSPVTGRIVTVRTEGGYPLNYQVHIIPDGFPAFEVRLFHVNPAPDIVVGAHVAGGQFVGYADMTAAENTDISVEAIVLGAPPYPSPMRPPGVYPDRGIRMFSAFDVMTDSLFADYRARGVASREVVKIPRDYRDANPVTTFTYRAEDWVTLAPSVAPLVVEYYHAAYDHYFITAAPDEQAGLDAGVFAGWARTGLSFRALPPGAAGSNPVCRMYLPPGYGDSHFYSASPDECAITAANHPAFQVESPNVFSIALPAIPSGACAPGLVPVYRVWNQRPADTNHRYTTSRAVRDQMVALGYVAEGNGPDIVTMCASP